jgi:acetylornithine deacetylase/succinyl-diaminopimelate desuccinylase-like protein
MSCLLFSASSFAATTDTLREKALSSPLAYSIVESLTVEVGPRIAGSEGDKRAVKWAQEKLTSLGFDKVYTQPVRVRNWSRGRAEAKVVKPFSQKLIITALGGSIATPEGGLQAPVVMFASLQELQTASKSQVKGKIVFVNRRMIRDRAGRGYGPVVAARAQGAIEASKLGAKAILIRSVGTDNSRFAHTGAMRYSDDVKKIPAGALSNADADTLEHIVNTGKTVELDVAMQAKEQGWQTSYNVIGEITGTEKPNEVVLLGAHLDSWDEGTGAIDDGAGVGIVSAAASLVKSVTGSPKRTIRVVLYANEEFGLIGARQYVKENKDSLENIVVAAESDFGAGKIYRLDTRFADNALPFVDEIVQQVQPLGVFKGNNAARGGPDISMFPGLGIPVATLQQDGTYYFDYHHTPNDTLDKIKPDDIAQNQAVYALFAYMMANHNVDPRPAPKS